MTPIEEAVAAWLAKADDDRRAMEVLAATDLPLEVAAFHAQQWAEKSLKAALVARDLDPPRTHTSGLSSRSSTVLPTRRCVRPHVV